jgi:signal transduction histidine kinase
MTPSRRGTVIYLLLAVTWVLIAVWQTGEHYRVQAEARAQLMNRAKDISTTLGVVLRAQHRFGVIYKERVLSALADLVKPEELTGIALLNAAGEVVASAGVSPEFEARAVAGPVERWGKHSVTLVNLVDLGSANVGTNATQNAEMLNPPIVVPREEFYKSATNRPPGSNWFFRFGPPPPPAGVSTNAAAGAMPQPAPPPGPGRPRFGRPPWMTEKEYKALLTKAGVHGFVMVLSTQSLLAASAEDLWLRAIIMVLATLSAAGLGLAWRNLSKTSELQLRLVRASELTSHLKEMNLAAAGLAHETRNPLNIIRGLAQMISKQANTPEEIRNQSRAIVDETDKVTAQLNEFINYSRPREVRRTPLPLSAAIHEVVRTLNHDIDEKQVQVEIRGDALVIEADEQLLRQALFNLLMNAIQALDAGGRIQVVTGRMDHEGFLEVRDNGPGVPPEHRKEVFKPYFTTHQTGTGLGLAVVQQIMLAHGWEIECLPNEPRGAIFRMTHLKLAAKH